MKPKKSFKKFSLKKETIANLKNIELENVKGGTLYLSNIPGVMCVGPGGEETTATKDPNVMCFACNY